MTPCIVLCNGGFDTLSSPPLADNDVDVAETELKEGEWQNISWLPFHLNTPIKAHGGWVSGVASAPDTDSLGFMQQKKLNVYCFGDLLDPRPDGSRLKILHVRYITLQQLISTANSQHYSFHPDYRNNAFRTPKASGKIRGGGRAASLCNVCQAIAQVQLSEHNAFITAPSWHVAWHSRDTLHLDELLTFVCAPMSRISNNTTRKPCKSEQKSLLFESQ